MTFFKIGVRLAVALTLTYVLYSLVSEFMGLSLPYTPVLEHARDKTYTAASAASSSVLPYKWAQRQYTDKSLPTSPIRHVVLSNTNYSATTEPTLLVLVMTKDAGSWGRGRNVSSFLDMLLWTDLDPATTTLALLTSSENEFETYRTSEAMLATDYASIHLIHHPGYADSGTYRILRHLPGVQHSRRVHMARLRNYASLTSLLPSHEHLLWIDADVYEFSPGLVQDMLAFSAADPRVGIQTAISHPGESNGDYDFNAWAGLRSTPTPREREKLRKDKGSWQADGVRGQIKHMGELRRERELARDEQAKEAKEAKEAKQANEAKAATAAKEEEEKEGQRQQQRSLFDRRVDSESAEPSEEYKLDQIEGLIRLDSVGATVLLMKAHLWRQGLSFATSYLVGTDWQDEGWDAVESEGLCVAVRNLINEEYGQPGGVGCWGIVDGYTRHSKS